MRILICEDEAPAQRQLKSIVEELEPTAEIIAAVETGREAGQIIRRENPDLIFMDIELSDGSCFDTLQNLEIRQPIIFTTAYDEYALKAFEMNSVDYLVKPISRDKVEGSLAKLRRMQASMIETRPFIFSKDLLNQARHKRRFLVKLGQRLLPINDREVAYFQASDKLVLLVTHEGRKYVVDYTLSELEDLLDPRQFFRLNRQFIASLDAISELESYFKGQVTVNLVPDPDGEDQVVISRRRTPELKSWLGQD